jgi:hypothetical protein
MNIRGAHYLIGSGLSIKAMDSHDLTILWTYKDRFQFRMWWSNQKGRVFRDKGPFSVTDLLDPTGPGRPAYIIPNQACAIAYKVSAINLDPRLNQQLDLI